jgi:arginyl-tRNA synthetase
MMHEPWAELRSRADAIRLAVERTLSVPPGPPVQEAPEDRGLFALAMFPYAKTLGRPPAEVAPRAAGVPVVSPFAGLRVDGPYLNLTAEPAEFASFVLGAVRELGEAYGSLPPRKERVLLEHTSANPNGPLHVGRGRNPILGDSLARLLRFAGYRLKREYLVNDIGRQMVLLYWAVAHLEPDPSEAAETRLEYRYVALYQKANELLAKDPAVDAEIRSLIQRFEAGDVELTKAIRRVGDRVLERIVASLHRLGIDFDSFFWESDLILDGRVRAVIDRLMPLSREEDGAHYLDLSRFGLEGDSAKYFFVKRDGTSLYTTRDLAYHLDKMARCDHAINVLGEDQKLSFQRLKATFKLMGIEWAPETIFYAFVNLPEGRMSTRQRRVVYLDDLMEEAVERAHAEVTKRRPDLPTRRKKEIAEITGLGALRYNIVRVQAEKAITFRWEEALNFEGNSAPFLQYAHARACSILEKVRSRSRGDAARLLHPQEQRLLRWIAKFPSTVRDGAESRRAHLLATFAADFAAQFNQFYRDCPVLSAGSGLREARLDLVDASRSVLRNAMDCLGVVAPSEM